jgi:signal transduction histidine kinase/ligand-binding sensor domain-containing protein
MTPFSRLVRCWLLADLIFLFASTARAASTNSPWSVHVWQSDDGLPNNNVTSLAQTTDGYLWVANQSQLVRFDGVQFEAFSPQVLGVNAGQKIRLLLRGRAGGLWLATDHGVVACVNAGRALIITNNLPSLAAQTLVEDDDGSLWVTYNRGNLYQIKNGQAAFLDVESGWPPGASCSMVKDINGRIWFAKNDAQEGRVGVYRDGHFQTLLHFGPSNLRLAAARAGGVWICSGSQLCKYSEGGKLQTLGRFMPEHPDLKPKVVFEDSRGAVWIGTSDSGLFRYDGADFENIPTSHPEISDIMEDREGNLWVGTAGGGLNRVRPRAVELEEVGNGLPFETVVSLCQDTNGLLWGATQNGFLVFRKNGEWNKVEANAEWPGADVACVAADRAGAVWIGTKSFALYCLKDGHFTAWTKDSGLAGRAVRSLLASSTGDLWMGGEASKNFLQCLRNGHPLSFEAPPSVRDNVRHVRALAEDAAGNIWVGTSGGILLKLNHDVITDETAHTGGDLSSIRYLYATPDGSLWIGYAGSGLGRLKDGHYVRITSQQGLYDDFISQIVADDRGWLWLGADHGIFKIRRQEVEAMAEGRAARVRSTHYGRDEGLTSLQASYDVSPGALHTRDGRLWMPMRTALAIINPHELHEDLGPPPVLLRRMAVDERTIAAFGGVMPVQNMANLPLANAKLRLPPRQRLIEFEFTALNLSAPENVHFRYQLEGFDDDWIIADTARKATYPQLPAGNYRFRVAACNSDGVWNETDAPLAFAVAPFLWQTWWFRAAAVITFTLTVTAIVRYVSFRRLRVTLRLLEQQAALDKERTRIARDLHDDLGGSLTQVALMLERSQRKAGAEGHWNGEAGKCTAIVRQVVKSVDEIIWAINPRSDTLQFVVDYLSQYGVDFLHTAGIRCRVELPERLPERNVTPEARHNLFLALKETLNNVARHAQATEVRLHITANEEEIGITVVDNGRGFAGVPDNPSSDGLRNMRRRMEDMGGQFQFQSAPGAGTRVSFHYAWPREK